MINHWIRDNTILSEALRILKNDLSKVKKLDAICCRKQTGTEEIGALFLVEIFGTDINKKTHHSVSVWLEIGAL